MPSTKGQPKARAPKGSTTRGQPKARPPRGSRGSPGGKMTHRLTSPKGY